MQYVLQTGRATQQYLKSIKNKDEIIWTYKLEEAKTFPTPQAALSWYQIEYDKIVKEQEDLRTAQKNKLLLLKGSYKTKDQFVPSSRALYDLFVEKLKKPPTGPGGPGLALKTPAKRGLGLRISAAAARARRQARVKELINTRVDSYIDADTQMTNTQKNAVKKLKNVDIKIERLLVLGAGVALKVPSTHYKVGIPKPEKFTTKTYANQENMVESEVGLWVIKTPSGYKTATTYGNPSDLANAKLYTDKHKAQKDADKLPDAFLMCLSVKVAEVEQLKPIKSTKLIQNFGAFNALIERQKLQTAIFDAFQAEQAKKNPPQKDETPAPKLLRL